MKTKSLDKTFKLIIFLLSSFVFLQSCEEEDEYEFIGNASMEGKLQYQDVKSGGVKDVPKGATIQVYYNSKTVPIYVGQTSQNGFWSYVPPAIGSYTIEFSKQDTLFQFLPKLIQKEDLDTTRTTELITINYKISSTLFVNRDEHKQNDLLLVFEGAGLRLAVKDENGQPLKGAAVCLYSNETFYSANFPNCGGSLKYIESDESGIALFIGLMPNTTYYVNARAKAGILYINNHYNFDSQTFNTGDSWQIIARDLLLK